MKDKINWEDKPFSKSLKQCKRLDNAELEYRTSSLSE
jgi:hypothetical protein